MPIINLAENFQEDGGWSGSGETGSSRSQVTRRFTASVTTDTHPPEILADLRVPQEGSPLPWDLRMRCRGVNTNRLAPNLYEIEARYEVEAGFSAGSPQQPTDEPARLSVSTIKTIEPIDEDINGDPIENVNGEKITGVTKPFADMAITIEKNLPTFNLFNVNNFADTVNAAPFLGFPAGTLRIDDISATQQEDYWEATAVIIARRPIRTTPDRAWWKRLLHEGHTVQVQVNGIQVGPVPAVGKNGVPVNTPVKLDQNGFALTQGDPVEWLEFEVFESIDFNNLNLYP